MAAFSGMVVAVGGFWSVPLMSSLSRALAREASSLLESTPPRALASGFCRTDSSTGWLEFGLAAIRDGFYPRAATLSLMVGAALT